MALSLRASLAVSVAAHGALVLALVVHERHAGRTRAGGSRELVEVSVVPAPPVELTPRQGPPAAGVRGSADGSGGPAASPWPRADVETPDPIAAAQGGGEAGGSETWTGRRDRDDLRAMPWNDPLRYQLLRARTGDARRSGDSIARREDPGLDAAERAQRRRARDGERGTAAPAAGDWNDADPSWDDTRGAPGAGGGRAGLVAEVTGTATQLAEDGAIRPRAARPLVAQGELATEAAEDGPAVDDLDAAQASNERRPQAFEMTRPRAGGDEAGEGVAGTGEGEGNSARSRRGGRGLGGTRADVPEGHRGGATWASAQDRYFRELYARVLARVTYPKDLALALEQGEVVVSFTLGKDGAVKNVTVARSSGFDEFDRAVVTAIESAGPFGPPPRAVSHGRDQVRVNAPFSFDNPLIR